MMIDGFGRTIDYLRLSITDRCDLRCLYCMPEHGVESFSHEKVMRFEELLQLCRIMSGLGVKKFKVSGGEPLVRRGTPEFIAELKQLPGVEQVTLTTNGQKLLPLLPQLEEAGLDGINLSLDSLDPQRYRQMSRRGELAPALAALEAACERDFCPVKLNTVLMDGLNGDEAPALAGLAKRLPVYVRFIELMPIGLGREFQPVPGEEVCRRLEAVFGPAEPDSGHWGNGPAVYYRFPGLLRPVGFIDAVSHRFCSSCNRIRLTAEGCLKLCLQYDIGCDLLTPLRQGASEEEIAQLIRDTVAMKPERHCFGEEVAEHREEHTMNAIGG